MLLRMAARTAAPMPLSRAPRTLAPLSACTARYSRAFSTSSNHHGAHHRQPTSRVQSGLDYYSLLEVHRHRLDEGELKAAYYRLAKQFHPDAIVHLPDGLRKHAEARFQQIGVAYAVLSDPRKRCVHIRARARAHRSADQVQILLACEMLLKAMGRAANELTRLSAATVVIRSALLLPMR